MRCQSSNPRIQAHLFESREDSGRANCCVNTEKDKLRRRKTIVPDTTSLKVLFNKNEFQFFHTK